MQLFDHQKYIDETRHGAEAFGRLLSIALIVILYGGVIWYGFT